jgi:hypothetical protein
LISLKPLFRPLSSAAPVRTGAHRGRRTAVLLLLLAFLTSGYAAGTASAADDPPPAGPHVTFTPDKPKVGDTITVTGTGWTPGSLVQVSLCGQAAIGGTNTCSQTTASSATVDAQGGLNVKLRIAAPPKPCPCVVRAATVTGGALTTNQSIEVEGLPVGPLTPSVLVPGRLVFMDSWMAGKDTIFNWFGSPVARRFEIKVANMGQTAITNPTFKIGTYEGVYAPRWRDVQWTGTIAPGAQAVISLDVELKPRQHGHFVYRVMYGDQVVDERTLDVGRPWGVYVFLALLIVVVPMTVWRLGSSLVHTIGKAREERAAERSRDVGMPEGMSAEVARKKAKPTAGDGDPEADADEGRDGAQELVAAGATAPRRAPTGNTPLRRVEETMVISGPLFADAGPDPVSGGASRVDSEPTTVLPPAGRADAGSVPPPAAADLPQADQPAGRGGSPDDTASEAGDRSDDDASDRSRVTRPEDVARGLAWHRPPDGGSADE